MGGTGGRTAGGGLLRNAVSDVGSASAFGRTEGLSSNGSLSTHLKVSGIFSAGFFWCSDMRSMLRGSRI